MALHEAVPSAVSRQEEAADALIMSLGKTPDPVTADPAPDEGRVIMDDDAPPAPDPAPDPTPSAEPQPATVDFKALYEKTQHSLDVLKGKYNKEIGDLISRNNTLATQNAQLASQFSTIQAQIDQLKNQPPAAQPASSGTIIDEDKLLKNLKEETPETYDILVAWENKIVRRMSEMLAQSEGRIKPAVEREVAQVKAETAQERFFGDLTSKVAEWRTYNTDPRFLKWLSEEIGYGKTRHDIMKESFAAGDSVKVAQFFIDWLETIPKPKKGAPQIHPKTTGGSGQPPGGNGQPKYTREDLVKLHREMREGIWDAKYDEAEKLEAEIMASIVGSNA